MNGFFDDDFWIWNVPKQMWDFFTAPMYDYGGGRPEPFTTCRDNGKAFRLVMSVADNRSPDERADAEKINRCVTESIDWILQQSQAGCSLETARRIRNEIGNKLDRLKKHGVLLRSRSPFSGGRSYCAAFGTEKYTVLLGEGDGILLWNQYGKETHERTVAGDPQYFERGRSEFQLVLLMCNGKEQAADSLCRQITNAFQKLSTPDNREAFLRQNLGEMGKQHRLADGSSIAYLYLPTAGKKRADQRRPAEGPNRAADIDGQGASPGRTGADTARSTPKQSGVGTSGKTPRRTGADTAAGTSGNTPKQPGTGRLGVLSNQQIRAQQKKIDSLRQQWSKNDRKYQDCVAQLEQMKQRRQSSLDKSEKRKLDYQTSVANIKSKYDNAPLPNPQADGAQEKSMNYAVFDAHTLGRSHKKRNIGCEDYSAHYCDPEGRFAIAVVCDGHSDPTCFRSAAGARFGCEAVVETLSRFLPACPGDRQDSWNEDDLNRLKAAIMQTWSRKVQEHLSAAPITEAELASLEGRYRAAQEKYRRNQSLQRIYGATLLAAAVCEGFYLVMQIGDGTMYRLDGGGYYSVPLPEDPKAQVTSAPSSLCDSDVLTREGAFRMELIQGQPQAIFLMTDGIGDLDSVSLREFLCNVQNNLNSKMEQPIEPVGVRELNETQASAFQKIVDSCANQITDDDCSLGGFYRYDLPVERLHLTKEEVDVLLQELERKQQADEQGYRENRQRVDRVIQELTQQKNALEEEKQRLEQRLAELTGKQKANQEKLDEYQQKRDASAQSYQNRAQGNEAERQRLLDLEGPPKTAAPNQANQGVAQPGTGNSPAVPGGDPPDQPDER